MMKRLLAAILAGLFLCAGGVTFAAPGLLVGTGYESAHGGNDVYASPDDTSEIVGTLATGEPVEILSLQSDWAEVSFAKQMTGRLTGWARADSILKARSFVTPPPPPTGSSVKEVGGILCVSNPRTGDWLNLREAPDTNSHSLGIYYNGATVVYSSDPTAEWVSVILGGRAGYMQTQYLKPAEDLDSAVSALPTAKVQVPGGNLESWVHLREEPSLEANSLGRIHNGQQLSIMGGTAGWCHVTVDGFVGFIASEFLSPLPRPLDQPAEVLLPNGGRQ